QQEHYVALYHKPNGFAGSAPFASIWYHFQSRGRADKNRLPGINFNTRRRDWYFLPRSRSLRANRAACDHASFGSSRVSPIQPSSGGITPARTYNAQSGSLQSSRRRKF